MAEKKEETFEAQLDRLQAIVRKLESGEFSLEESIMKFEEGMSLAKSCQDRLNKAEQRIEILSKVDKSSLITEPFMEE